MFSFTQWAADKFPSANQRQLINEAYAWCKAHPHERLSTLCAKLERKLDAVTISGKATPVFYKEK